MPLRRDEKPVAQGEAGKQGRELEGKRPAEAARSVEEEQDEGATRGSDRIRLEGWSGG
jgi:hypothetical protein